jgi:hypothetical protein
MDKAKSNRTVAVQIVATAVLVFFFVTPGMAADAGKPAINIIVVNYDPVLSDHGGVRLQQHMKWNDPRPFTTNLVRYIREASGGLANYRIVDFIHLNAFPAKRDGFRYTEESFLEMWKDRKKAHQTGRKRTSPTVSAMRPFSTNLT